MAGRERQIFVLSMAVLLAAVWPAQGQAPGEKADLFRGQDLHLAGAELISFQLSENEHSLVFPEGFSMSVGGNQFSSDSAVVWLKQQRTEFRGKSGIEIKAMVYLRDNIKVQKNTSARAAGLSETLLEVRQRARPRQRREGKAEVVQLAVSGEIFVTADKREISDTRRLELYKQAFAAVSALLSGPRFVVRDEALVPEWSEMTAVGGESRQVRKEQPKEIPAAEPREEKAAEEAVKPAEAAAEEKAAAGKELHFRYPVNLAPAGETAPMIEKFPLQDGTDVAMIMGRIYIWQKQDEKGGLLELQADNAVVFYSQGKIESGREGSKPKEILGSDAVQAVYLAGDVVLTEGQRTIRADEIYYDFENKKALVTNAEMRSFDVKRGIPIYVRAAKLKQLAENKFSAENVVLTSSESYRPQISLTAGKILIVDMTTVNQRAGEVSDSGFDAQMKDVRMKVGETTVFRWPMMRSNLRRPDVPFKTIHLGHDNTWGTSLETEWYLSRLLGLREPKGTESTLNLDYYSERGVGAGAEIEYERENYFGRLLGYVIDDRGKDRLGRLESRRDLEPPDELRGRFLFQHRHFLPYGWQFTTEVSYASDERFIESYYRGEFDVGKKQETLIHLKRLEDNWALSILGKGRINDYADELEETPSVEFHWTGQSLFDDTFTLYSDTQVSRIRQRIGDDHTTVIDQHGYSFASHRTELDLPLRVNTFKIVPFAAGTFGYDDRSGFTRTLVDGSNSGSFGEDQIWIGEAGVRAGTEFWKIYPSVKSRLWDLNQLRHIIRPQVSAVFYEENDSVAEQRDILNFGISQRLQTRRGPAGKERTVDWMRLDVDVTWVNNSDSASGTGPDKFIWNQPMVPLRVLSAPDIFNGDLISGLGLERFEMFGPRRNYIGADYIWRLSDTAAVLSDMHYDIQTAAVQQFDVGISRLCRPNLGYYIGSRYLRRVEVLDEKGSNAFVFAATYEIDPRYTLIFAQQFDFDYGANMRSDISLIRRYHRLFYGVTYSADRSLDRQAIVFSIWPQGVPEMAIGPRRYMK